MVRFILTGPQYCELKWSDTFWSAMLRAQMVLYTYWTTGLRTQMVLYTYWSIGLRAQMVLYTYWTTGCELRWSTLYDLRWSALYLLDHRAASSDGPLLLTGPQGCELRLSALYLLVRRAASSDGPLNSVNVICSRQQLLRVRWSDSIIASEQFCSLQTELKIIICFTAEILKKSYFYCISRFHMKQ